MYAEVRCEIEIYTMIVTICKRARMTYMRNDVYSSIRR